MNAPRKLRLTLTSAAVFHLLHVPKLRTGANVQPADRVPTRS
jgi:heme/copper-type cytochrome/quinol oxidase subunit 2